MTQRHRDAGKAILIRLRAGPIEDSEASGESVQGIIAQKLGLGESEA
jgi:hypothetical protein